MNRPIIDAHIHLDMYKPQERQTLLAELSSEQIEYLIAVSSDEKSSLNHLTLSQKDPRVMPALGYHPEQPLPTTQQVNQLSRLIRRYLNKIVAIGEIGLPYYMHQDHPQMTLQPYIDVLQHFIELASELDKPVVLHAIYEDADIVCNLLEKHEVEKAHFHWFKGSKSTLERMIKNQYYISVTPDCLYESEIQSLIKKYPIELMMVETDGPWPFKGPFKEKMTHPKMIHESIQMISQLKDLPTQVVYHVLYQNTVDFYQL